MITSLPVIAVPPLIFAFLHLYIGIVQFALFFRPSRPRVNLYFSFYCFGHFLYAVFCAGLYSVTSTANAANWQQLQFFAILLGAIAQVWFISEFTGMKAKLPKYILSSANIVLLLAALIGGKALLFSGTGFEHTVTLINSLSVTYREMTLGSLWSYMYIVSIMLYLYYIWCIISAWRGVDKRRAISLMAFLLIYLITVINDALTGQGIINSIYLLEYSFIFLTILMTQILQADLLEAAKTRIKLDRAEENLANILEFSPAAIAVLGSDQRVISLNRQFHHIFGYSKEDFATLDDWFHLAFPDEKKYMLVTSVWNKALDTEEFLPPIETGVACKSGQEKTIIFNFNVLDDEIIVTFTDVTEQRMLLRQKESLIQELYHRTKNNLQLISSFINIKADLNENEVLNNFAVDVNNKVYTMSIIQRLIYASKDISRINLRELLLDLTIYLQQALAVTSGNVSIINDFDDVFVQLDHAIPCGFVLDELITNSLKHAFPGGRTGKILIKISRQKENFVVIDVIDDGIGMDEQRKTESEKFAGLSLIKTLVEDQLQGQITFKVENGVAVRVEFSDS